MRQEGGKAVRLGGGPLPAAATLAANRPNAKNRYIVLLADGTSNAMQTTSAIAADTAGITPTHVYEHVFNGFAAVIPDDKLADVKQDPRVLAIEPDVVGYAGAQIVTTGITRIGADLDPMAKIDGIDERVDVDVAVLDTAGDDFHPDLNIWAWPIAPTTRPSIATSMATAPTSAGPSARSTTISASSVSPPGRGSGISR